MGDAAVTVAAAGGEAELDTNSWRHRFFFFFFFSWLMLLVFLFYYYSLFWTEEPGADQPELVCFHARRMLSASGVAK